MQRFLTLFNDILYKYRYPFYFILLLFVRSTFAETKYYK